VSVEVEQRGFVRPKQPHFGEQAMRHNANVCDRAGTLKPRPVPYTKLYKDMKTMENTSPPHGANIMLWVRAAKPP
jgi:hypothetical protein